MFKQPFKGPQERKCKICEEQFIANRPSWKCNKCIGKEQRNFNLSKKEIGLTTSGREFKQPYPYPKAEQTKRFRKVKNELKGLDFREDWQEYFSNKLNELIKDAKLMKWIYDRRDNETNRSKKIYLTKGRPRDIRDLYPDTRQMKN